MTSEARKTRILEAAVLCPPDLLLARKNWPGAKAAGYPTNVISVEFSGVFNKVRNIYLLVRPQFVSAGRPLLC